MNIHTKNNFLSAYGLACGYVDSWRNRETGEYAELYKEHGVYHVRLFVDNKRLVWDSFYLLAEARKRFKEIAKL